MSEVTIEQVQKELEIAKSNIKGLVAQLDAAKQMINEGLSTSLQLRTNLHMFQQAHQELGQAHELLKAQHKALSESSAA